MSPEKGPNLASLLRCRIAGDPLRREVRLLVIAGRPYSPALGAFIKISRSRDWNADDFAGASTPFRAKVSL